MQRLSRGPKLPLLRARSFRFDRRRRSLSVSATRPVRHSAPLRLSLIARSHEVDLVDTWRADSQSLNVARLARNYPMCENEIRLWMTAKPVRRAWPALKMQINKNDRNDAVGPPSLTPRRLAA